MTRDGRDYCGIMITRPHAVWLLLSLTAVGIETHVLLELVQMPQVSKKRICEHGGVGSQRNDQLLLRNLDRGLTRFSEATRNRALTRFQHSLLGIR
jgi:hypothetical protein